MVLQNTFYIMAIILMSLMFLLMVVLVIGVFYIKRKIDQIHRQVTEKIDNIVRPAEMAVNVGSTIAATAFNTFKRFSSNKKKESKTR
jgi:flagellar basal body-associated protein FliL